MRYVLVTFNMLDSNTLDWIKLSNISGIGSKKFWSLVSYYKTAAEALKHISYDNKKIFNDIFTEKFLHNNKCKAIIATEHNFPDALIHDCYCPPVLYYRGDIQLLNNKTKIGIIGARNSSISGRNIASSIAENLAEYCIITSGMAHGIDTSALTAVLNKGYPVLAILPFGFDNIYPKDNIKLFERIAENGLVITSVFPNRPPDPSMFHIRNRLLVLLSKGIVVIEAAVKSGTMSTANLALELGREVMVVPGSPLDHRYYGSNLLIKNGAPLVQNAQDVLEIIDSNKVISNKLNINICIKQKENEINLQSENDTNNMNNAEICNVILSKLSTVPITIDELVVETNFTIPTILSAVSELVLSGKVIRTASNALVIS